MSLAVDCLGLVKSMQIEGDIDYDQNGFYQRLLPKIAKVYENSDPDQKLHNFSNVLYKIVENYKSSSQ